jgi:hypothetical protein
MGVYDQVIQFVPFDAVKAKVVKKGRGWREIVLLVAFVNGFPPTTGTFSTQWFLLP